MTRFLLGGAIVAVLAAFAPASAQTAQPPALHQAPANQVHTRAQVGVQVAALFQRLDTNRDGFITRAEGQVAKGHRDSREARQSQRRGNRSPEQRMARRAAAFDRLDANRDGVLSRSEFARPPGGEFKGNALLDGQNHRRPPGMRGMRGGMGMAGLRGRMFDMADADRDGRVSMQEATAAAYRRFDMADANRDGQVTREERMQVRQQMRALRRPG